MRNRKHWHLLGFILFSIWGQSVVAQEIGGEEPVGTWTATDEIRLQDGTILRGTLLDESPDGVLFKPTHLDTLRVPRDQIRWITRGHEQHGQITDPDQNTVMFCPTPATLPRGRAYLRDYEVFWLNIGASLTDNFDLSASTILAPFNSTIMYFAGGAKLRLLDREKAPFGLALTGGFTLLPDNRTTGALGAVAGVGNARHSLNFSMSRVSDGRGRHQSALLIGADWQLAPGGKLLVEYLQAPEAVFGFTPSANEYLNFGLRVFWRRGSLTASALTPTGAHSSSMLFVPMLMYSYQF